MNVRSRRVSSTHFWRGRIGEMELWMGTTRLSFVGLLAAVLKLAAVFFLGFSVATLGVLYVWAQASQPCPFSWWLLF